MKKIIVFLMVIATVLVGCCGEDLANWNVKDFTVGARDFIGRALVNNEVHGDSIRLAILVDAEFVYHENGFKNPFLASAYALSCPDQGRDGMDDKIVALTISSTENFNAIHKDSSLNHILVSRNGLSVSEWLETSEKVHGGINPSILFEFTEKPAPDSKHIFKVVMVMESGIVIERMSEEIIWK